MVKKLHLNEERQDKGDRELIQQLNCYERRLRAWRLENQQQQQDIRAYFLILQGAELIQISSERVGISITLSGTVSMEYASALSSFSQKFVIEKPGVSPSTTQNTLRCELQTRSGYHRKDSVHGHNVSIDSFERRGNGDQTFPCDAGARIFIFREQCVYVGRTALAISS
ncbi:hypothetical protein CISG_09595 [Coccidioides immitis RMSCC 3703]|uniref:Uncharacterized protein n=1 Tax=Coccidioides immitis RMSCC 3703 TaxID=454286 RepID=A0A0J8RCB7_COCIT|nr:hypothetical protein CISG_09595 [Coccidioides immitis RMSCC 3703]